METFALDPRQWRIARVFSTNPLVRRTDRVEALALLTAMVVSLIAIPVAAVVATTVYEAHRQMYADEARARHPVAAATATRPAPDAGRVVFVLRSQPPRTADAEQIWVDDNGNRVPAPTPLSRAQFDAASVMVAVGAGAFGLTTALVTATRWRLDRVRALQSDRELGSLLDDGGGRTNDTGYGRTA